MPLRITLLSLLVFGETAAFAAPAAVDPYVTRVETSDKVAANGDFLRLVVFNTEHDPCLTVETVNIRQKPGVVRSDRFCELPVKGLGRSLTNAQSVDFAGFVWKKGVLQFDADYLGDEAGAAEEHLACTLDGTAAKLLLTCDKRS